MQRQSANVSPQLIRTRKIQPVPPGATRPTIPLAATAQSEADNPQPLRKKKRLRNGWNASLKLLMMGFLLEVLFYAFYPLLAQATTTHDAAQLALQGLFPWLPRLYWTNALPQFARYLSRFAQFNPLNAAGSNNLLLLLLSMAFALSLFSAFIGRRIIAKQRLTRTDIHLVFWVVIILSMLFSVTFLFAPAVLSQEMFLYGIYGRMVTVYHLNPYVIPSAAIPQDMLQAGVLKSAQGTTPYGPAWIDLTIVVTLFAGNSIANIIFTFRLIGLVAHLLNTTLIWTILAKLKPELRISSTLIYAWNPLVLLFSISGMHAEAVMVTFFLLAVLFFQRKSAIRGWIFLLLVVLMNMLWLLLLPLFLRLLMREGRVLRWELRSLRVLAVVGITALMLFSAYLPYWDGWGMAGILLSIRHAFLQDMAVNSLNMAILTMPVTPLPAIAWITTPHHWTSFALIAVSIILLFGLWLADTLQLVLLFSSWLALALLILMPVYWPWFILLPLVLAIGSTSSNTRLLALLLSLGAMLSFYWSLWQPVWASQALVTIGLPLLLWGWTLFFTSTWQMTHNSEEQPVMKPEKRDRTSWPSRPSWPSLPTFANRRKG